MLRYSFIDLTLFVRMSTVNFGATGVVNTLNKPYFETIIKGVTQFTSFAMN